MRTSLADLPRPMPRKCGVPDGERRHKPLADLEESRVIGGLVERALLLADITKQDAAFRLGYSDQSAISRWVAGVETPQLAKLWTLGRRFRQGFLIAMADACEGSDVEVRTVVTVARRIA